MKLIAALILTAFLSLPAFAEKVCSAHDGDTFKLCNGQSIRVAGIDAPEIGQPMGKVSRDYARKLLIGREVDLECTGKSYKRLVCSVSIRVPSGGSLSLERELVGRGLAYDAPKYSGGKFADAEAFARTLNRGVWTLPGGGVRPWDWRREKREK